MKFNFKADVTFEADSVEDALSKIGARVASVRRHVSDGTKLQDNKAFFTITPAADTAETIDILHDPVRSAQIAAEVAAKPAPTE